MKKIIATLIAAIIMLSCSGKTEQDLIKIGWLGSLTGGQEAWGICEYNTFKMMLEDLNASGGITVGGKKYRVQGVSYDTKGLPDGSESAAQRLAQQDGVVAILGPTTSRNALAISKILEAEKTPNIATMATNPRVTFDGKLKPYNFRACFIDPYQGSVAAAYAFDVIGSRRAAILYDSTDEYSYGMGNFFADEFEKRGGSVVAREAFNKSDCIDFRQQLIQIKISNPDIIFMPYFYKEISLSAKQAREMGLDTILMGGDGWESDELIPLSAGSLEGCYFVTHLDINDPDVAKYRASYKKKYGLEPSAVGYLLHDAFMMLIESIKLADSIDRSAITEKLETLDIKGITGHIKINKDTHNPEGKEAAIIKISQGSYVFQQKYSAK